MFKIRTEQEDLAEYINDVLTTWDFVTDDQIGVDSSQYFKFYKRFSKTCLESEMKYHMLGNMFQKWNRFMTENERKFLFNFIEQEISTQMTREDLSDFLTCELVDEDLYCEMTTVLVDYDESASREEREYALKKYVIKKNAEHLEQKEFIALNKDLFANYWEAATTHAYKKVRK